MMDITLFQFLLMLLVAGIVGFIIGRFPLHD